MERRSDGRESVSLAPKVAAGSQRDGEIEGNPRKICSDRKLNTRRIVAQCADGDAQQQGGAKAGAKAVSNLPASRVAVPRDGMEFLSVT